MEIFLLFSIIFYLFYYNKNYFLFILLIFELFFPDTYFIKMEKYKILFLYLISFERIKIFLKKNIIIPMNFLKFFVYSFFLKHTILEIYFFLEKKVLPIIIILKYNKITKEKIKKILMIKIYSLIRKIGILFIIKTKDFDIIDFLIFKPNKYINKFIIIPFIKKRKVFVKHKWLPYVHKERKTKKSIILKKLILKMGKYGINIFLIFLKSFDKFSFLISKKMGRKFKKIICKIQKDIKMFIKWRRINHINLKLLKNFSLIKLKKKNSYLLFVIHGIIKIKLFFIKGNIFYKNNNRLIINILKILIKNKKMFKILIFKNKKIPPIIKFIKEIIQIKFIFKKFSFLIFTILKIYKLKRLFYNLELILKIINTNKKIIFNKNKEYILIKLKILLFNFLFLKIFLRLVEYILLNFGFKVKKSWIF